MSIEKSIKKLKMMLDWRKQVYNMDTMRIEIVPELNEDYRKAIEDIINDYTRQKQINEEHQKINGELREKVKELKEENKELMSEYHNRIQEKIELEQDLKILEQKIKDKIEELKEDKESKYYYSFLEERDIEKTIGILQELLQESEENNANKL